MATLMGRLAENVSFGLGTLERDSRRRLAEAQKERLTRMFAALSATNEAIVRAKVAHRTVRAGVQAASTGGNFTSTDHCAGRPTATSSRSVAAAGPSAETTRNVRLSIDADLPRGAA